MRFWGAAALLHAKGGHPRTVKLSCVDAIAMQITDPGSLRASTSSRPLCPDLICVAVRLAAECAEQT
jgi:hypothetical protein